MRTMHQRTAGASIAALRLVTAAMFVAPGPAAALTLDQNLPIAATLDNPCTAAREAIAFTGTVHLVQEVSQLLDGNLRLILSEQTAIKGRDTLVLFGGPLYTASGTSKADVEFLTGALSILSYKKVIADGVNDNFHAVLVMAFNPSTLTINLGLKGACDSGQP